MKKDKLKYILLFPIIAYTILLIVLPLIYILVLSFLTSDSYGGTINQITLTNYLDIFSVVYIKVFLKSFLIALISTFICVIISYPFTLFISQKKGYIKNVLITLVMIPFLTNSLIRTYGWIILLRKSGIINTSLMNINLIENPLNLMYNDLGIIIGMVYTLLPFMILPLYSSVSKVSNTVTEAAADLGANKIKTFFHIIVPLTKSGLFNGILMVFIPCLGYFFISDLLGGGKLMLLGNLIKNQFLSARNWPFGAAIAIVLLLISFLMIKAYKKLGGKMEELGGF